MRDARAFAHSRISLMWYVEQTPFAFNPRSHLKNSFTLTRAELEAADAASLKARILSQTGCEAQAASILRSLERIGTDPTIEYYEMIEIAGRRMYGTTGTPTWRVRADRGVVEEPAQ